MQTRSISKISKLNPTASTSSFAGHNPQRTGTMSAPLKDSSNGSALASAETLPQSPRAMVDAVMAEATAERARLTQQDDEEGENSVLQSDSGVLPLDPEAALQILMESSGTGKETQNLIIQILDSQIESLVQEGLTAFHANESIMRDLVLAKEELDSKDRELQRLRASEESSRHTITNLLRAVESSKSDIRDSSRHVQIEAKLRSDLIDIRSERDEARGELTSLRRKVSSMEEDMRVNKAKLARVEQEKVKIERDSRAAISLAKSAGSESSSDVDFYKRKTSELQNQLSAQQALCAERKGQIDEMRRQQERSMSQNRLANMRSLGSVKRKTF